MTRHESLLFTFSLPVLRWQVSPVICSHMHAFDLSNLTHISTLNFPLLKDHWINSDLTKINNKIVNTINHHSNYSILYIWVRDSRQAQKQRERYYNGEKKRGWMRSFPKSRSENQQTPGLKIEMYQHQICDRFWLGDKLKLKDCGIEMRKRKSVRN